MRHQPRITTPRSDRAFTRVMSGQEQRAVEIAVELCEMDTDAIYVLTLGKLLSLSERRDYYALVKGASRDTVIEVSAKFLAKIVPSGERLKQVKVPKTVPAMSPVDSRVLAVLRPKDGDSVLPATSSYSLVNHRWRTKPRKTPAFPLLARKVVQ
jgi:hypothetical protein